MLLLLAAFSVFAQGGDTSSIDLSVSLATFSSAAALTLVITGWLKTNLKIEGTYARYLSWGIAIVLSLAGWFLKIGMFEGIQWYLAVVYGFGIGLISNGIFTSDTIKTILSVIGAQLKSK